MNSVLSRPVTAPDLDQIRPRYPHLLTPGPVRVTSHTDLRRVAGGARFVIMVGFGGAASHPEQLSYEELAARNAELRVRATELLAVMAEQATLIESLRAEMASLLRQAGRDSSNLLAAAQPGRARGEGEAAGG